MKSSWTLPPWEIVVVLFLAGLTLFGSPWLIPLMRAGYMDAPSWLLGWLIFIVITSVLLFRRVYQRQRQTEN